MQLLDKFFKLKENSTSIKKEFFAACTTFLAMLYIIPVGADILSQAGMPKDSLITSVSLVTAITTLLTGIWANVPVAMSAGMGLNIFFTFGMVQTMGLSWQQALGAVFLSGLIFLVISFTNLRAWIMQSIPKDLRIALCCGLGAFIATIGLKSIGIITTHGDHLGLGSLTQPQILISIFGIFLLLLLHALNITGSFILSIFILSIIGWAFGYQEMPRELLSAPSSIENIFWKMDILGILNIAMIPAIVSLLITDLFDSLGTLSGIGIKANLFQDTTGKDKQLEKTLQVDALATTAGPIFGLSTTTAFLESATGVNAGGRTGLTAVFVAFFFFLSIFFLPVFSAIPSFAIYPTLVVVGSLMFLEVRHIDFRDLPIGVATFFTIILMPLTSSITIGLAAGFVMYTFLNIIQRKWERLHLGTWVLLLISIIPFAIPT
ncbi:NCS2 family permease [Helicobacter mustelae]|uniref:Putative transmembrane transport protein n=1 Tax=Helicobacter mustelae (strain ATCC 43772 / CCUG 25715 / CIP 103759 / LMG 18044 / NCTC 12198 / R85-136P) TaxID=679897 RepID=D3UHI4_HELM1|nr:NCS2 family permease [Helicobacter mustelae]CBG39956.1 putative transmembrane transport protein [Helicobacter mustelae 12198]SQH71468.1 transmembrane transport protein [Helicobacter mustelae]